MNNSIVVGVLESENTIRNAITARFGSAVDVISCRDVNEWMEMLGSHQLSLIIAERHTAFTNAFLLLGLTKEAGLDCPFWLVAQQVSDSDDALLSLAGVAKRISINEIDHALLAISTLLTGGDAIESIETELVTGLFEWNLADQHTYFSPSCLSIWGRETDTEAANIEFWWACISDLDKQFVKAKFDALLSSGESNMVVEHRLNAELGMTRWCRVAIKSIKDSHGKVQVIEGTVSDITAERAAQKDLISRALSDPSGLANNTFFNAQLERVLTASKSSRAGLSAVVFFNISRLQLPNTGNDVLRKQCIAQYIKMFEQEFRNSDLIALVESNCIAVILENLHSTLDAHRLTSRVIDRVSEPLMMEGHELKATWHAGIVTCDSHYQCVDDLIHDGFAALYKAVASSKTNIEVVETHITQAELDEMRMDMDLKHAFDREEFRLLYQPIVAADTGKVVGLEALIRWRHPIKGLLTPYYFMEAAEASGLIVELNKWALNTASKQVFEWQERFKRRVQFALNFNVGKDELSKPSFFNNVKAALDDTGMAPGQMKLEISERVLMNKNDVVMQNLTALQSLGVQLCIHDFGKLNAPISALIDYPVNAIKLHPTLTQSVHVDKQRAVISAIISLADSLDIEVAALGVEEIQQRAQLKALGCGIFQGYGVAQPTDAKHTPQVIKQGVTLDW